MKRLTALFLALVLAIGLSFSAVAGSVEKNTEASGSYDYTLDTVDGEEITAESINGYATVFVFFSRNDNNGFLMLDDIQYSDWITNSRVKVIAADVSAKNASELKDYSNYYGFDDITFCYDKSGKGYESVVKEISGKSRNTEQKTPLVAIADQNGSIQHVFTGYQKPDDLKTLVEALAETPEVPQNFRRSVGCVFAWDTVADASGYKVYRSETPDGDYVEAASVKATVWSDVTAEKNKTYFYRVKSIENVDGTEIASDFSATVALTPVHPKTATSLPGAE